MDVETLRASPHISASTINDYVECGLSYKFSRIDKLKPDFTPDALVFGTVIHRVVEEFYQARMINEKMLLKQLQELFEEFWTKEAKDRTDIQYKPGKDFKSILLEGKELLAAYYTQLPEDNFKVLAIEEPISFYVEGVNVPVIGFIDLMEEDQAGTIIITDFKTSQKAYSFDDVNKNTQLTLYKMGMKKNGYKDREILLRFDCLIKTKTPKFEQCYTSRTELDELRLTRKIQSVWEGINKGVFIPNDQSWRCKNCNYKSHCDNWFGR